jgi:hypothetical protein
MLAVRKFGRWRYYGMYVTTEASAGGGGPALRLPWAGAKSKHFFRTADSRLRAIAQRHPLGRCIDD